MIQMFKAAKALKDKARTARSNVRTPVQNWASNMTGGVVPDAAQRYGGNAGQYMPPGAQSMMGGMLGAGGMGGGGGPAPVPAPSPGGSFAQTTGWNPSSGAVAPPGAAPAGGAPAGWDGNVDNIPGSGARGNLQAANMPEFLKDSPAGYLQQQMLASLFGGDGSVNRQFLNQDLSNIRGSTQQAQRDIEGHTRFRGSPLAAIMSGARGQAGTAQESRRLAQAESEELQRKAMVNQMVSQGFTGPMMQALGLGSQAFEGMSNRAMQEGMQPSMFEKSVGQFTGLVGAFMCWVARAVLRDERWTDARIGLIHEGSPALLSAYLNNGQALASRVDSDPSLRAELTPVFESLAERGREIREARGGV